MGEGRSCREQYPAVWRAIVTSEAAHQYCVFGAIPRTYSEFNVCMNYSHIPVMLNEDSLTMMVTCWGTMGAIISWGGYALWRAKHLGQNVDLSITRQALGAPASPTTHTPTPQYLPTLKPVNPMLVEVHCPANNPMWTSCLPWLSWAR